jgi:hypothetical protein
MPFIVLEREKNKTFSRKPNFLRNYQAFFYKLRLYLGLAVRKILWEMNLTQTAFSFVEVYFSFCSKAMQISSKKVHRASWI